jgi:hypothetical protein
LYTLPVRVGKGFPVVFSSTELTLGLKVNPRMVVKPKYAVVRFLVGVIFMDL